MWAGTSRRLPESRAVLWSHQRGQPGAAPLRFSQRWLCECGVCIFNRIHFASALIDRNQPSASLSLSEFDTKTEQFSLVFTTPEKSSRWQSFHLNNSEVDGRNAPFVLAKQLIGPPFWMPVQCAAATVEPGSTFFGMTLHFSCCFLAEHSFAPPHCVSPVASFKGLKGSAFFFTQCCCLNTA